MKTLIVFLFVVSIIAETNAQQGIRMSSRLSKHQKFVADGTRVFYESIHKDHYLIFSSSSNNSHPAYRTVKGVGILRILNDSTIQVGTETIKIDDLLQFSAKKKGAEIASALFMTGGFLMVGGATTHKENGQTVTDPALIAAGLAMTTAGLVGAINRIPKKSTSWRFEVTH
jgi:hypothetical protein